MNWYRQLSTTAKFAARKYLGTDFDLDGVRIDRDFKDQARLLSTHLVKTIIDVGANLGQTTLKYRKIFPEATIHAFEPFPQVYQRYQENFGRDAKIKANNLAVSDTVGKSKFYLNEGHYTNSLLKAEDASYKNIGCITVETVTMDAYARNAGIDYIDILKADVQGAELKVLKGARDLINDKKISLIFIELEFLRLYKDQPMFYDICKYLADRQYSFYNFYGIGETTAGQAIAGDAIFISPKICLH